MGNFTATPDVVAIITGYEQRISALERTRPMALTPVTALPTAPFEGQEIIFAAAPASGIMWRLRYRGLNSDGSANASAYKWEAVGAQSPLIDRQDATVGPGAGVYGDLGGATPSVTLPLAGDWLIRHGAGITWASATADVATASVKLGAAATSDNESVFYAGGNTGAGQGGNVAREFIATALASGSVLKHQYKTVNALGTFKQRFLSVTPVRVG